MKNIKSLIKSLGYNQLRRRFFDEFIKSTLEEYIFTGKISLEESRFLGRLVQKANQYDGPIIEIGTLFGYSTLTICLFKDVNKQFLTVDNFRWNPIRLKPEMHYNLTGRILSDAITGYNLSLIKMSKDDFYAQYDGDAPAMVFFDADHSYEATLNDLKWAKSVAAKIICGHDYKAEMPGVIKAVDEISGGKPKEVNGSLFLL